MNPDRSLPSLSLREHDELQRYRSLSALAVVSLLLGLLSFIAIAHPAAWLFPAIAVFFSTIALVRITRRQEELTGRGLAVAGLMLGLFFLACAPARYFGDRWMLQSQARGLTDSWFADLRAGNLNQAHQATLEIRYRQPEGTALDEYYEVDLEAKNERDAFFNRDVPRKLVELGPDLEYEFERDLGVYFEQGVANVTQRYWIRRKGDAEPVLHVQTEMQRLTDDYGIYWVLVGLADAEEIDRLRRRR